MKTLAAFLMLLAACSLWAQDYPRVELSAGYSYGSVDTQGYGTQRQAQGWSSSFAANVRRWVGAEFEVSGRYNALVLDYQGNSLTSDARYYTFLSGPRFAYRKGKATPFVHALFGVDRAPSYDQTLYDPINGTGTTPYATGFASAIGGGFDYAMSRHLTFRTQGDYLYTRHASLVSPTPSNFRVQAAIVFTFGQGESLDAKRKTNRPVVAQTGSSAAEESKSAELATVPMATQSAGERASSNAVGSMEEPDEAPMVIATATSSTTAEVAVPAPVVTPEPAPIPALGLVTPPVPIPMRQPVAVQTQTLAQVRPAPAGQDVVYPTGEGYRAGQQKQEESLGEVARRYRAMKQRRDTSNGL